MTKNSGNIAANDENIEQANAKKTKKADESLTTRAIKEFIEKKLSSKGTIFDEMVKSKCVGLESEFMRFVSQNSTFDNKSKEQQESFQAVNATQFLRETIAIGAAFTSKRKALEHVIGRGYEFSEADMKKIRSQYENLSRDELTTLVQSEVRRERFLKGIFPKKTLPYKKEKEQLDFIFGHNILSQAQEELVVGLLTKKHVDPVEVQEVLDLFDDKQKQLLLKTFLPTITLGELGKMGVLTNTQIKSAIHQSIERGNLIPQFASMSKEEKTDAVDQIDPNDIVIETMLFPKEIVDTILLSQGCKMIAQELSRLNTARYDEVDAENSLKMKPTKEGLFFPSFIEKLNKLGIKNTADLKAGSIIQGTIPGNNGKDIAFAYRIDDISDEPQFNKGTAGNGRVFAISDILLPDGSLHLKKAKSKSAEFTYAEIYHIFDKAKTTVNILSPENIKHHIDIGAVKETILPNENELVSINDLNRALDSIDFKGKAYPLKADGGATIQVGKPGDKDYHVYQITSVNEKKGTIEINDGQTSEVTDYITFYKIFESKKSTRLPSMKTAFDFIGAMKMYHAKKDAYTKLAIDGDKIISDEQKDISITEFAGSKNLIKILDTKTPGQVEFVVYKDYDETKGLNKQKESPTKYIGRYNLLFAFLNTEAFVPKITTKETEIPDQAKAHIEHKKGRFKHYMGNPSIHDIFTGAKGVLDAIKHRLEHGSQLHAANVQLSIGKGLKRMKLIDDGILREMQGGVYEKNKKLMQEMVDALKKMSAGEREEEVKNILTTHGSHDYEIQAVTLAMLQKHGALYIGKLQKFEGSFIFFERIAGVKYSKSHPAVISFQKRCDETGEPFTEAGLIISYLKAEGTKKTIDPTLWLDMGKGWAMGMKEEGDKGKIEVDKYQLGKGRIKHVADKLAGGEYAHGLGGIEGVWDKGGSAHMMHFPAILLALTDMPSSLHQDQLNTLKNKFYGGHPYTALLFLGKPQDQDIFRGVIKEICANNGCSSEYANLERLQKKGNNKEFLESFTTFWEKYGEMINNKLNVTKDGELLHLAKKNSDCAAYLRTCEGAFTNVSKLNDNERDNEAYEHEGSSFLALNPNQYFKFIRMNPAQATFEKDDTTERLWSGFQKSLGAIRGMNGKTPKITREMQQALYMKYHKALMFYFNNDRLKKAVYEDDLPKQNYMQELKRKYGIRLTMPSGTSFLETPQYAEQAKEDFEAFLAGGREDDVKKEVNNVGGSVTNLLEQTGWQGAANDEMIERAA